MRIPFLEKNTLECRLKAARAELAAFKTGKKYQDIQEMHRKEVHDLECRIRQLEEELAQAHRDLKTNTGHWMEVFDDLEKEHQKEVAALTKQLARMEKRALRAERERDECKDKITQQRHRIYEVETALEEEKGKNTRLKAQLGHDHETSSIPSSKGIRRKKITNSREKSGKKPGGQPGHEGHRRRRQEPTFPPILLDPPPEVLEDPDFKNRENPGKTAYKYPACPGCPGIRCGCLPQFENRGKGACRLPGRGCG